MKKDVINYFIALKIYQSFALNNFSSEKAKQKWEDKEFNKILEFFF